MARVNYAHGKRQREIASKTKREEKLQRKAERSTVGSDEVDGELEGTGEVIENEFDGAITPVPSAETEATN